MASFDLPATMTVCWWRRSPGGEAVLGVSASGLAVLEAQTGLVVEDLLGNFAPPPT